MPSLPTGTVTLLFTDIEGSTRLARRLGDGYRELLATHRRLLRGAFTANGGVEVDTQGDAFFFAFGRAHDAVAAAADAQRTIAGSEARVRIGIHTGEPALAEGGYYVGVDLSRAARICAAAHGGQVLLSRATFDLVGDIETIDLGEHVLKDIEGPERLFQLIAPGLEHRFPAPRASTPGNLPRTRTAFVGRERELDDLRGLLLNEAPVVTLTGPGGVGKTRLALEAARELSPSFTDGAYFVSFAARPADLTGVLAQALEVEERAGEPLAEAVERRLQTRHALLVLDNFESALDAAPQVASLVEQCPQVKVLATSRVRLHLGAEHEYRLGPLTDGEASDLFNARATAASPTLDVDAERGNVAAICRRLDRLPLALELAAARARILPLAAILDRLDQRLTFLTGGARDLPERQRTLAATIDWSYALLDAEERATFDALAVFVDGASLDGVERVASAPERALDVLTSLCDQSLLISRASEDGTPRFRMLATIREFALTQLRGSGAEDAVRRRHAAWFVRFAERAEPEIQGRRQAHVLQQLATEHDNLRAALTWAAAAGEGETLVRLAAALWRFWFARGHLTEGRRWLARALVVEGLPPDARARALRGASVLAAVAGELGEARALAEELVEVRRELGVDQESAEALVVLANVETDLGNHDEAAELYEQAAEFARRGDARPALAGIMNNLGYLSLLREQPEAARTTCRESAALFEELGFGEEAAGAWLNAASADISVGELAAARIALRESLDRYAALQHAEGLTYGLETAAAIAARSAKAPRAAVLVGAAAAVRERTGGTLPPLEQRLHDETVGLVDGALGVSESQTAQAEGAKFTLESALDLAYNEIGDPAAD